MRPSIFVLAVPLVLSAALAAVPAAAADAEETVTVEVPYADLDLTAPAGQAALDARIDAAVEKVCAKPDILLNLKAMTAWEECKATARTDAKDQLTVLEPYQSMALASLF